MKFAKILGKENIQQGFYGQEINPTTYNLARYNMFLHDIGYTKFNIARGDTLKNPKHWDEEPFDVIVSNPPYSIKWEGDSNQLLLDNISYILDLYKNRQDQAYEAKLVPNDQLADNDYNLSVNSYVEKEDTREVIDINELNEQIRQTVARENELRQQIDEIVQELENE